eukprot:scaffold3826_cov407-Prasinococcus_capsulatus_cf.AAC.12
MDFMERCMNCGGEDFVEDHSAGDLICTSCGAVAQSRMIDESSEWRTFNSDKGEGSGPDPNRVGGIVHDEPAFRGLAGGSYRAINPLLKEGGLGLSVANSSKGNTDFGGSRLVRHANKHADDRMLLNAFGEMGHMASQYVCLSRRKLVCLTRPLTLNHCAVRLGLPTTVTDRANEIFAKIVEKQAYKGRTLDSIYAATLYIACRQDDKPRTFKELCAVCKTADKRDISKAYRHISKHIPHEELAHVPVIHASDFIRRFASHLGMKGHMVCCLMRDIAH